MNFEETQYHPRYSRSEYVAYLERERSANRHAFFALMLVLLCAAGIVYVLT